MYEQGRGVSPDKHLAHKSYSQAAKQGPAEALFFLEHMEPEFQKNVTDKTSLSNIPVATRAQYNLGVMYEQAQGVK